MALYYFKGQNALGDVVQGRYFAKDKTAVSIYLMKININPLYIHPASFMQRLRHGLSNLLVRITPIRKITISTFYYQLSGMLAIDVSLKSSLLVIANNLLNKRFASIMHDLAAQVTRGVAFGSAIEKYARLFSKSTVRLLSLARSRLDLVSVLQYSDEMLQRRALGKKVLLIIMPQLSFFALIVAAMLFVKIRYLQEFYYAAYVFNKTVPLVIQYFDSVTSLLTTHLAELLAGIVVGITVLVVLFKSIKPLRMIYDTVMLYIPFVGQYQFLQQQEQLSLITSILLKNGATVQKCMEFGIQAVDNLCYKRRLLRCVEAIKKGGELAYNLKKYKIFGSAEVQLVSLGVTANNLQETFERIYEIDKMLIEKRLILVKEVAKMLMYGLNLFMFITLVVVVETVFFYAQSQ